MNPLLYHPWQVSGRGWVPHGEVRSVDEAEGEVDGAVGRDRLVE